MTNTTKSPLALRAHSIRNLSASELRVAQGGCGTSGCFCTKSGGGGGAGHTQA